MGYVSPSRQNSVVFSLFTVSSSKDPSNSLGVVFSFDRQFSITLMNCIYSRNSDEQLDILSVHERRHVYKITIDNCYQQIAGIFNIVTLLF